MTFVITGSLVVSVFIVTESYCSSIKRLCTYVSIENDDDYIKSTFYDRLKQVYDYMPSYAIKIIIGDLNAKVEGGGIQTDYRKRKFA